MLVLFCSSEQKKARRFLPSAAPTIPTGGKGYSTSKSIEHLFVGGNVRYRTIVDRFSLYDYLQTNTKGCQSAAFEEKVVTWLMHSAGRPKTCSERRRAKLGIRQLLLSETKGDIAEPVMHSGDE